jgi:hypothetical protein
MSTAAPRAAERRGFWMFVTHFSPLAVLAAIPITLITDALTSPYDWFGSFVITAGIVIIIIGALHHRQDPCARCTAVLARRGADGAVRRAVFIRLSHYAKPVSAAALGALLVGTILAFVLKAQHVEGAAWSARVGAIVAYSIMAALEFAWVSHIIYRDYCPVEKRAEPRD